MGAIADLSSACGSLGAEATDLSLVDTKAVSTYNCKIGTNGNREYLKFFFREGMLYTYKRKLMCFSSFFP
jgi:hypothetical protein